MAEVMGREKGIFGGRGGSQHICATGFFSNGVQGGMLPVVNSAKRKLRTPRFIHSHAPTWQDFGAQRRRCASAIHHSSLLISVRPALHMTRVANRFLSGMLMGGLPAACFEPLPYYGTRRRSCGAPSIVKQGSATALSALQTATAFTSQLRRPILNVMAGFSSLALIAILLMAAVHAASLLQ
jgi:hypothetical protein